MDCGPKQKITFMQFGKVPNLDGIDFGIKNEALYADTIVKSPPNSSLNILTGCTGWAMSEWKGEIYPSQCKSADFLKHYSEKFPTVELNSSFYSIPKIEQIKKWYEISHPEFEFCPKVNRAISQSKNLGIESDAFMLFLDSVSHFEDKLGPCFMQLPEYFDHSRIETLAAFLKKWPSGMRLAVELRHGSWFDGSEQRKRLLDLFQKYQQSLLMTDVAGFREGVHQIISQDYIVIRWVGNNLHTTDYTRIINWLEILDKYHEKGIKNTYFLIHEPDNVLAPKISSYISEMCHNKDHVKHIKPTQQEPDQLTLF